MNTATRESWIRLRNLVKRRDKATCYHCGKVDENGHCDHLIPLSKGGTDSILNLVWSCKKCNLKKGNNLLDKGMQEYSTINKAVKDNIIIRATKILFVSPLPEYSKENYCSFLTYFEYIIFIRKLRLYSLVHDIIWPIPENMRQIIKSAEFFILEEKYFIKQEKLFKEKKPLTQRATKCPVCNCSVVCEFFPDKTMKWLCPAGHYGDSDAKTTSEMIEYEKIRIAKELFIKLYHLENPLNFS